MIVYGFLAPERSTIKTPRTTTSVRYILGIPAYNIGQCFSKSMTRKSLNMQNLKHNFISILSLRRYNT